jgi:hypothetical protein
MKLSFSINSSKPKLSSRPKPASADDPEASTSVSQFVTEFDPTQSFVSRRENAVIAPIPNSDYIRRFEPTLPLPSAEDDPSQLSTEANFVLDTNTSADPSGLPYGLSIRSDKEKGDAGGEEENGRVRKREERAENRILKRFKEDMQTLPDEGPVNNLHSLLLLYIIVQALMKFLLGIDCPLKETQEKGIYYFVLVSLRTPTTPPHKYVKFVAFLLW